MQLDKVEPDENAYFVRDFFPCRPNCTKAIEIGERFLEFFDGLGLGDAYRKLLPMNIERVRSYQSLVDHP